jgi:hypothetical protein
MCPPNSIVEELHTIREALAVSGVAADKTL